MRVHFIAIGGAAMHNLAIALKLKGYDISGSDDAINDPSHSRLKKYDLLPEKFGWFPERIINNIDSIILGMHAKSDNPELLKAKDIGLKIYSYPEFIFNQSKDKIRIVIGGSHGKTSITSIILHVLRSQNIEADYMVGAQLDGFDVMVKLTESNKFILLEGDEYLSSAMDLRPKFHLYKPHIALLSGISWDHINVFKTFEDYIKQLHGKDISYNNLLDIDASIALLKDLQTDNPVFLIHKHNNPCGVAIRSSILEAYEDALACDNVSAFGGVLCSNKIINKDCANRIDKLFFEILIAPDFDEKALSILKSKKNRILVKLNKFPVRTVQRKSCLNGFLEQDIDDKIENFQDFKVVTNNPPNKENSNDLVLASIIAKHTKSNCIVIVKNQQLIGSGMGQVSRIDALNQAIDKSKKFGFELKGSNLASDAFFPFSDCVEIAFKNGIDSIVQPGGSVRDQDSIDFCNENEMSMVFSGIRHFRH